MAKFVKLGDKANSFSCPTSGFTVSTKTQVKELTAKVARSKKVQNALKGGHLVYAEQKDFDKQPDAEGNSTTASETGSEPYTEEGLKKLKLDELKTLAISLLTGEEEEDDINEEDINAYKAKAEVIEFILEKQDEEEEE